VPDGDQKEDELEKKLTGKSKKPKTRPTKVVQLGWGLGAEAVYDAVVEEMIALAQTDPKHEKLGMRVAENAVRLATVVAIGRGAMTIDRRDIEWAVALVKLSFKAACEGVDRYVRDYFDLQRFCDEVLAKIAEHGGARSIRDLKRDFRGNQRVGKELQTAIDQLKAEERIEWVELNPGSGASSPGYRLTKE
jgi:hypothetical protein